MKRTFLTLLAGLLFNATSVASMDIPAQPDLSLEISPGAFYNRESNLVLLGYTEPAPTLWGEKSFRQFNLGAWDGPGSASIIGFSRGIQWDQGNGSFIRVSTGTSLISATGVRLSTAFQFYEQFMIQKNIGNLSFSLSYRHWSNASIKRPNYGMDFLGGHVEYSW